MQYHEPKQQMNDSHVPMPIVANNEPDIHVQTFAMIANTATDTEVMDASEEEYQVLIDLFNSTCAGVASCQWSRPVPPVCDGQIIQCNTTTGAITGMYLCFWHIQCLM